MAGKKAAPKKEEPKSIELQMKQPDGSVYNWHPSGAIDAKCLDAFDESKQTNFAPEEEKFLREYIEKGICQCGWAGNEKFLNKEQAAIFGLWLNDKNEDPRRAIVLGEERMKLMLSRKPPFDNDDIEEEEKVASPASSGVGEAEARIDVENFGGNSKVHVDTEEQWSVL